ncbi:hypothetical protein CKQ80_05970 [Pseudomonas moraviensis]|uniref:Bacterial Ig-like domain-containing protein n=1 Tax=Pseudomonas moraviensis TaxID=321662 RepID=A0A2A2PHM1_9PSED|nr:hypothetical protein [Pseudomonas moraviensis]PAW54863.1 hypothetical protein CKQ80_05970 [Pseudomonas moraviensis]
MDIQSSTLNQLFVLYPLIIQGSITPVKPDGIADVGVSRALVTADPSGLEVLIDPWVELQMLASTKAAHDRVDVYVDGEKTPAGKTIAPGEENQRLSLYIPSDFFNQGVNTVNYVVTRVGGNVEESRKLIVLYNLRPSTSLVLTIPPDVVTHGVSADRAAQGVVFTFTYTNRRSFDRIEFKLGDTIFRFNVPDAPAPITLTLLTADFEKAGDGPDAVAEFYVIDQLGNRARSSEQIIDIHLSRLDLRAPTVIGQSGNNFSPTQPQIRVMIPTGLLPSDLVFVNWTGSTAAADGSYTSPQRLVSAGLEFAVPRSVLAFSLNSPITVDYTVIRNGVSTTSPPLKLNILPLPASALIPPKIIDADANNVLDVNALGTKDATIHGLLWTLIEAGQQVWLWLEGKKADGSAHNLTVWNGGGNYVNATWLNQGFWPRTFANSFLKQLGHNTPLTLHFLVALDKSNIKDNAVVFPLRTYTIRSVALVAPTITSVKDLSGWEIPDNGYTVHKEATVSGTAPAGQEVEVFVGSLAKGKAKAATNGAWSLPLTGLKQDVPLSIKAVGQYATNPSSNVRKLTVVYGQRPAITAAHDASGVVIANGGTTSDTSVTLSGTANAFLEVEIFDGTTSKGKVKADGSGKWRFTLTGLTRASHGFTAKALYGSSTVSPVWTVIVGQEVAPTITSVKGTINTSEIANGASTYEKKIVLTGAASPNALVEIYDGSVRKGQIKVNASGVWTQTVSELIAGLHSFTVKAVYGSGAVSAQRKLTVQVVLSENFDSYPSRTITAGGQITLPSMTIAFSGGSGSLGITALSSIKPTHGGPFSAIANRSSGQILEMHVDASGTSQDMRINFNWSYSAVSCYCRFAQFSDISVYFYNQTNQQIQHEYLLNQAEPQLVSCTSSENNIWSMRIVTKRMDLIAFDFFTMQRR